jgi:hypothetical protein
MRLRRLPLSLLLLSHAISVSATDSIPDNEVTRALNDVASDNGVVAPGLVPRGTTDAPVDGQDGRPHEGPFVETSSERDRKKAKELGQEASSHDQQDVSKRLNGDKIPVSNDGVMDDRNSAAPKEGTRGTEGGVSEKSNSNQAGVKKTPDSPKEPLPLPDSAYGSASESSTKTRNSDDIGGKPLEV